MSLTNYGLNELAGRSGANAEVATHQKGNCFIPKSEYSGVFQLPVPSSARTTCVVLNGLTGDDFQRIT